jgi:hypothetical protein
MRGAGPVPPKPAPRSSDCSLPDGRHLNGEETGHGC